MVLIFFVRLALAKLAPTGVLIVNLLCRYNWRSYKVR